MNTAFKEEAQYLKVLAHPTRLRIIEVLSQQEHCVSNLETLLNLKQANVSQHLALLSSAGIVASRRDGMRICYSLADPLALEVLRLLERRFGAKKKGEEQGVGSQD